MYADKKSVPPLPPKSLKNVSSQQRLKTTSSLEKNAAENVNTGINYIVKEKKSHSINNRPSPGKISSAFSEPVKQHENHFKISSWADKNQDENFLYQNVSNNGTNYIEYKLKNIKQHQKKSMETVKEQTSDCANSTSSSVPCPFVPNRQIEVRTVQNRTVVKISVDTHIPSQNNLFIPVENDLSDYQYPEVCFGTPSDKTMPSSECTELYANVDYTKKKSRNVSASKGIIHENPDNSQQQQQQQQVYMNLNLKDIDEKPDKGEIYMNVESGQVYENEDFTFLRNSKVTQSIIESRSLPEETSQIYENGQFLNGEEINDSFTGPFITSNEYDTPRPLRLIIEKEKVQLDGQFSPSETFDSGTGSDQECQSKTKPKVVVTVTAEKGHKRAESVTSSGVGIDSEVSDEEVSNISSDSLNSAEDHGYHTPTSENKTASPVDFESLNNHVSVDRKVSDESDIIKQVASASERIKNLRLENKGIYHAQVYANKALPEGLLKDIRNVRLLSTYSSGSAPTDTANKAPPIVQEIHPKKEVVVNKTSLGLEIDTDKFYKFHLKENVINNTGNAAVDDGLEDDESFAGFKDYLSRERSAAITSAKGTIRGVRNRVKAGIATFLQLQQNKAYRDRDAGKVVVYSTTMGIVRETYQNCLKVKQILRTLMVKFEERNVFMSRAAQDEIRERMKCNVILVPQIFVEGQYIGDAETIERLNESGELRRILKPYKSADACTVCNVCGGYRLLLCSVCKGSKKSVHRNSFTKEFISLKCMHCDPVGLIKCHAC